MNTPANAMPEIPNESKPAAPAATSPTRPFYWSVRRELWENRSIYMAPLIAAGVVLFGFLVTAMALPGAGTTPCCSSPRASEPPSSCLTTSRR